MAKTAVVFHSGYGHTQRLAQAVADGAQAELVAIDTDGNLTEAQWAQLDEADAIIMGSPTYMGSVSWQFKKFADASSKRWYTQAWKDKLVAGFTASANVNGDKLSTLHYMFTLAMQHGMIWCGTGLNYNNTKASNRGDVSAADMNSGDLETGRLFGQRIAQVAARLRA
jgi:NAD(P)H dehydrogenase (quinone)